MSRLFLAAALTTPIFERFAADSESADLCSAVDVYESALSRRLLADPRWRAANIEVWDRGLTRVARFNQELALAQTDPWFHSRGRRGVIAAGLDGRLRLAGLCTSFHDYCSEQLGSAPSQLQLVADDPYTVDAFRVGHWLQSRPAALSLHAASLGSGLRALGRELSAGQSWVRMAMSGVTSSAPPSLTPARRGQRTCMVLAISIRSVRTVEPALRLLERQGWRVVVVYYGARDRHLAKSEVGIPLDFAEATAGFQVEMAEEIRGGMTWSLSDDLRERAPVSEPWLRTALDASWLAGTAVMSRSRRLLRRVRPDVVVHFAHDVGHLALESVCAELGVPTVYIPHGFEAPARNFYFFGATTSALYGSGCVENNSVATDGLTRPGLLAMGHVPHDRMLGRTATPPANGIPTGIAGLTLPPHRPHLVLGLAGWGDDFICHVQQERFLSLLAAALPPDAYLVCKLHPGFEEREQCERALAALLPRDAYRVVGEREHATFDLIQACDVAVSSERSMVMVDTFVLGKPIIGIRHPESPLGRGDRNHPGKRFDEVCPIVDSVPDLQAALVALTREPAAWLKQNEARQQYLQRFVRADGRAAERLVALIEHLAAAKSGANFQPSRPSQAHPSSGNLAL